ncbi:MAG TPA: FAD-dependent oxidoreductase [Actinomycetota bacterium]|nr:FAD-dependent oxidoreductase [Actinomycetota bacterium]
MTRVEVAVVGGGVIGLSVARELARAGVADVVVLEREAAVGQGSSARANGGVRAQFTTEPNVAFSLRSIEEFERLERETGLLGFHQTGYLLFTGTPEGERGLRAACELQRRLGVPTEWLGPEEVLARAPFLRPDGLRAGTFHARDGFLDPHGVVQAYAAELRRLGVEVRTGAPVTAIERGGGRFRLATPHGPVEATWVVDAAGADAAEVAAMVGVRVPVEPVRRNLAFVRDEPGPLTPMCVDLDTGVLVRREVSGGWVLAYSDPADPPGRDTSLDPTFLPKLAERVGNRFPHLQGRPIDPRQCWAGLYPETPDHHAVIGEAPGVPGFVLCAGFGGHGVMHSPAAGIAVAELVARGGCTSFDLHSLRPSRFEEGDLVVEAAVF